MTGTVRMVPREGLSNPVFAAMQASDHLIVAISFARPLDATQKAAAQAELDALGALPTADPSESVFQVFEPFLGDYQMAFRIGNTAGAARAVWDMTTRLSQHGVQFRDAFFSRWAFQPHLNAMGPVADPRAPMERPGYPNPKMYLDDLWNPQAPMPPASEFPMDLKGAFMAGEDRLVLEIRGTPIHFPGFRIGYGLHPTDFAPPDARAEQVRQALVTALEVGWRDLFKAPGKEHMHPTPRDREGNEAGIEKVVCGTRVGYSFAVESVQLLDWPCPDFCRFREYELFEAALSVVAQLGLAPVITWQRFGRPMMGPLKKPEQVVIQLWEVGGEHASRPGLDAAGDYARGGDDDDEDDEDYDDEDEDYEDDDDEDEDEDDEDDDE